MKSSSLFSCDYESTAATVNPTNRLKYGNDIDQNVEIEIISRGTIKPASPTPDHLKTFNLSIIDQFIYDVYIPLILFLPNTNKATVTDVVTKRSKHLKETLSETLTQFYPFAGKVKDNLHVECNDEGVYFIEARVNQTLDEFLSHPDDEKLRELMPEKPRTEQTSVGNYVIGVQVNIFNCGGIGLSTSTTHKIFDFHTYMIFMKAWAASVRDSPETIHPSFVASEIFPNAPHLTDCSVPSKLLSVTKTLTTKRFVFNSKTLAHLKSHLATTSSREPTRMEATTAVIWKAVIKAASTVRSNSLHALLPAVNLRKRASPTLPENSIGNLVTAAGAICFPESQPDLKTLICELRESISKVDSDYIESMKGEKGPETVKEILKKLNYLTDVSQVGDCMIVTSVLNMGIYDLDFGWGKPIWFYYMNPGIVRLLVLVDTVKGGGVEAIVTLSPDEMEIFEGDLELLSYATINPTPTSFVS